MKIGKYRQTNERGVLQFAECFIILKKIRKYEIAKIQFYNIDTRSCKMAGKGIKNFFAFVYLF